MRLLACLACLLGTAFAATPPLPRVLFFANPMTSDNDVIRRPRPDTLSVAERHFAALAAGQFAVTITQDGRDLGSRAALASFDLIVFFTAINPPGVDVDALVDWVRAGGAFGAIHSAANTYQRHAGFGALLGARYDRRPWRTAAEPQTRARLRLDAPDDPIARPFRADPAIADDLYQFKEFDRAGVTLLLSLDPAGLDLQQPKMNRADTVLPVAWKRTVGRGRVFYTALGDWEATWADPRYRAHLLAGLRWTLQRDDAR